MTYPVTWPKANPKRPDTVASRTTEQQRLDLWERRITTRELAKQLGVHEKYVSSVFPGKQPIFNKKPLIEARKALKLELGREVIKGKYSISQAAKIAFVSYNTMMRAVNKVREIDNESN